MAEVGESVRPSSEVVPGAGDVSATGGARSGPLLLWLARRQVALAALMLIIAQVAWRAQFLSHLYFFREDILNLDLSKESQLSWHYLTFIGTGHLMIGERVIVWIVGRVSLYNWGIASAVSLAFVAAADLAAFRLLRTLFGGRPAILVPFILYLLTPLSLSALGWWTEALEVFPFQLATFMAINSHVFYVRTGRFRHLVAAVSWVTIGMIFFEKGMVLPLLLFGMTAGYLMGRGSWLAGVIRTLRRYWRSWLLYLVLMTSYAVLLAESLGTAVGQPQQPHSMSAVVTFCWGLIRETFLPGAIGGPWRWFPVAGGWYALSAPPNVLTWLALIAAVTVVAVSIWRWKIAWRSWVILAGWVVLADMVPVVISRLDFYPLLHALDTHYVADAVPVLAVCVGLAFLPVADNTTAGPATRSERRIPASVEQRLRTAAAGIFGVLVFGSIWSTQAYQSDTTGSSPARYMANAVPAIRLAARGTAVLDGTVPYDLSFGAQNASASRVLGDVAPGKLRWVRSPVGTIDGLRIFGPDGKLDRAFVYGAASVPRSAGDQCFPAQAGRIVIRFWHSSPSSTRTLRIGYLYFPKAPTTVDVTYGGTVYALAVRHGLHSVYLPVTGSGSRIAVSAVSGVAGLCVGDAEAGTVGPTRAR